jgi:hypothetical protein
MMKRMMGAFMKFDRGIHRDRSIAAQTATMIRGIHCSRPRFVSPEDEKEIVRP